MRRYNPFQCLHKLGACGGGRGGVLNFKVTFVIFNEIQGHSYYNSGVKSHERRREDKRKV